MKVERRRYRVAATGLLFLLSGCGGCREPGSVSRPTPATATATTGAAAAAQPTAAPTAGRFESEQDIIVIFGEGEPDAGPAPLTVEFAVRDPFMRLRDPKFQWDFGDGSPPSDKRNPKHTYENPGKYVAKVVVKDVADTDSDTVEIHVGAPGGGEK